MIVAADAAGTLPTPWNTDFVFMAWVTEVFTKTEIQQRQQAVAPDIEKVPLQGFLQCSRRVCRSDSIEVKKNGGG